MRHTLQTGRTKRFHTVSTTLNGSLCGEIWWPAGAKCGVSIKVDLRREFERFTTPVSFRECLLHILMERSGDFQNASFTADTTIRIKRVANIAPGRSETHTREIEVSALPNCADLVDAECFASDFYND